MRIRRWKTGAAVAVAAALAASACGSSSTAGSTDTTMAGGQAGNTAVKVTSIGYCNEIYLWWAQDKGIFEAHGLDVELVPSQGGAAGIAAIMSGAADFSFTNGFTALLSLSQGFPIQFTSGAYENAPAGTPATQGIWVTNDSGINSAQDLVGKKIGVNELGGINMIAAQVWLRGEGVDPKTVDFVALPMPQLGGAVTGGQIDAASIPLANITAEQASVLKSLDDPMQKGLGRVEFAGYLSSDDFMEDHADAAEKFQAAMAESIEQIQDPANVDAAFKMAGENCKQDPALLASQPQNPYDATISTEVLQQMGEVLVQEGQLKEVPSLDGFVPEFAQEKS